MVSEMLSELLLAMLSETPLALAFLHLLLPQASSAFFVLSFLPSSSLWRHRYTSS